MIKSLTVAGFRAFDTYRLEGLSRINLLVGGNNCGKTSLLEAIQLLVSNGDPGAITSAARRRDEMGLVESGDMFLPVPSIAHIFHGHVCEPGATMEVRSQNKRESVRIDIQSQEDINIEQELDLFDLRTRLPVSESLAMFLSITIGGRKKPKFVLGLSGNGLVLDEFKTERREPTKARFLSPCTTVPLFMEEVWNKLVSQGRESEVVNDMKILIPDIASIHFLPNSRFTRGVVAIGRQGQSSRIPLDSYGDGVRRLLLLRLSLSQRNDACILVDEIDTGLHWTAMAEMWRFLVEVARNANLQVFTTTHSFDCISGLASMITSHPQLANEVSIQKLDTSLKFAVNAQGSEIPMAVERGIDFR